MIKDELTESCEVKTPRLKSVQDTISQMKRIRDKRDEMLLVISDLDKQITALDIKRKNSDSLIKSINSKIKAQESSSNGDVDAEKTKLKELAQTALKLIERKNELTHEKSLQEVSLGLLKDSGIKASIVKEYLPILNKMINKYLTKFEFFVNFELDENFNETIRSRGRDTFQYYSFSEGEKKRIDLSILMTFRQIASMKNSAKIDLLLSDEVDSGMDMFSVEKYVELLDELDCNAWVISHVIANTELINHFDKIAVVSKTGDFSNITLK